MSLKKIEELNNLELSILHKLISKMDVQLYDKVHSMVESKDYFLFKSPYASVFVFRILESNYILYDVILDLDEFLSIRRDYIISNLFN